MDRIAKAARFGDSWAGRHAEDTTHATAPNDHHQYNHGYGARPDDNHLTSDEDGLFCLPYPTLPTFPTQSEMLMGLESDGTHLANAADLYTDSMSSQTSTRGKKRSYQHFLRGNAIANKGLLARDHFPSYPPPIPTSPPARENVDMENPYASDHGSCTHPHALVRCGGVATPAGGRIVVDGFIKTRIRFPGSTGQERNYTASVPLRHFLPSGSEVQDEGEGTRNATGYGPKQIIRPPPPRFGDVRIDGKFERLDRYLFRFFTQAVCSGRTVVNDDNAYLNQITPMADKSPAVKHAMLSVSLSYVLDYTTENEWKHLATHHYQQAVWHISQELKNTQRRCLDNGDTLVASLILLGHTEIVVWDRDQEIMGPTTNDSPKWYQGAKLAEWLLSQLNSAASCQNSDHIQTTRARSQMAIRVCLDSVLSDCVHPLDLNTNIDHYSWLIQGTERERRRIDGFAGLSPDLMHYLAKITYLAAMRVTSPSSLVQQPIAHQLQKILNEFRQWSALSDGYDTFGELLHSCELDEHGKVRTTVKVTELIGESYVAAAQIYLQCRVFRRRRDDPFVKKLLGRLILTIKYQPISGPLFTAQTPLFAVFVGGIVAYEQDDRKAICEWFDPICQGPRGNVPPAYGALKHAWRWLDDYERRRGKVAERSEDDDPGEGSDGSNDEGAWEYTDPWWEKLVTAMILKCGRINLC